MNFIIIFKSMIMKKTFLLFAALLIAIIAYGQAPDFSGKWKLNNSKSALGAEFSMAPLEIVVTHKGNDFTIEKHSDFQGETFTTTEKYTLDGKECLNSVWQDMQKKSTVTWSNDKKSFKVASTLDIGGELITITEVFMMDGSNLVIDSSSNSSFGDMTEKMVYDKI